MDQARRHDAARKKLVNSLKKVSEPPSLMRLHSRGVWNLKIWIAALSSGLVASVVTGALMPRALWGVFVGYGIGVVLGGWQLALMISTAGTVLAMSHWGWTVALALLGNWFSWHEGLIARGAALATWIALGEMTWANSTEGTIIALCNVGVFANMTKIFIQLRTY